MSKPVQMSLLVDDLPGKQAFDAWHETRGGRLILQDLFRRAAWYAARWKRSGKKRTVSPWLLWALTRDHLQELSRRARRRGIEIKRVDGFTMNNSMLPHAHRFIVKRRPEWKGMFQCRELGANRKGKKLLIDLKPRPERQTA